MSDAVCLLSLSLAILLKSFNLLRDTVGDASFKQLVHWIDSFLPIISVMIGSVNGRVNSHQCRNILYWQLRAIVFLMMSRWHSTRLSTSFSSFDMDIIIYQYDGALCD